MKKTIFIGDSIRMGYQNIVQRELDGLADVWGPEQNGGNSQNVLTNLTAWAIAHQPDIIHVNCGLHDIKTPFDSAERAISLAQYQGNVREILARLRNETQATIIWATTTPVNYAWHHQNKDFDRFEGDVDAYNTAATAIATELEIPIDDLFAVVINAGRDALLVQDGVHFNGQGYALLGKTVADCVRRYLGKEIGIGNPRLSPR